jgi:hypothetical protein
MSQPSAEFLILESFFAHIDLPESIELEPGTKIPDVKLFVEMNLERLRSGQMNEVASAGRYYRMNLLKNLLVRS